MHQNHPGIQAFGLGALGNLATAEDNCVVPWLPLRRLPTLMCYVFFFSLVAIIRSAVFFWMIS